MKFLADMGISPGTVSFLKNRGHDAIHLKDEALSRLPDSEILAKARHEQRVLLTHDLDFGELVAASGATLPSVVIFRLRNMRPENVNAHLEAVLTQHQTALVQGAVISVTEGSARVRLLPIDTD